MVIFSVRVSVRVRVRVGVGLRVRSVAPDYILRLHFTGAVFGSDYAHCWCPIGLGVRLGPVFESDYTRRRGEAYSCGSTPFSRVIMTGLGMPKCAYVYSGLVTTVGMVIGYDCIW